MAAKDGKKRPWNSLRYPKAVTVRVTEEEHAEILRRAGQSRLSASRFLVRAGLDLRLPPLSDRPPPTSEERRDLEFLLFELRKIGVNLNQLAKRRNKALLLGRVPPPRSEADRAAAVVMGLVRLIKRRL